MPAGVCANRRRRRAGSRNAAGRARHVGVVTTTPTDAERRGWRAWRGARRAPAPSRWRTSSASTPAARAWAEPGLRAARGPRLARAPMAAPDTTEEILDVNRRYHDVAAADYDTKWGVD